MNEFLARYKYTLLTATSVLVLLFVVGYFLFPKMKKASEILVAVRSEIGESSLLENNTVSPDSLIASYKKISADLDSYVNVSVSASKILTFILDASKENGVVLQDLSTGEVVNRGENLEYPVRFKANSSFPQFHRFLTALENSTYCVKVENVDMTSGSASVNLSVLSKSSAVDKAGRDE
ncbi:hypothetical protein SAMN05720766_1327 [Fibrobacter sp. UWH9]|uniref:hypothetical protein n=1 Tax=Fibrobacter sp. UWH9 TaxID=1896213 RepID=UPI0009227C19|nr:hypothetical protein [Fibrobacter sp. UWH9]SHH87676.1 hypothetical protein SAMN05720766_1327 [Fibrobacter sp. UWH9]